MRREGSNPPSPFRRVKDLFVKMCVSIRPGRDSGVKDSWKIPRVDKCGAPIFNAEFPFMRACGSIVVSCMVVWGLSKTGAPYIASDPAESASGA